MQLHIYTGDFRYLYALEDFTEVTVERKHLGVSTLRAVLWAGAEGAGFLQRGHWLRRETLSGQNFPGAWEMYRIQKITVSENRMEITAVSPWFLARRRLIKPENAGQEVAELTGSADEAVKSWAASALPEFGLAASRPAPEGEAEAFSADSYSPLDSAVEKLLKPRMMGIRCRFDRGEKSFTLDTAPAADKTMDGAAAAGNSPVIFSIRYDNIVSLSYSEDEQDVVTTVFARDSNGTVQVYGDEAAGFDRREEYISLSQGDSVRQRVEDTLTGESISFEAEIYQGETFTYGADYDIGDVVTAWVELPAMQEENGAFTGTTVWKKINRQITAAREHYKGAESTVDLTFGDPPPTMMQRLTAQSRKQKTDSAGLWKQIRAL